MADHSNISWTRRTWNPLFGCSRVSEGCRNCYAEQVVAGLARKMRGTPAGEFYGSLVRDTSTGPRWTGEVQLHRGRLLHPLRWREPGLVFVNSLSDVFHESVPVETIAKIFAVMYCADRQTFQVLTKRPARALEVLGRPDWPKLVQDAVCDLWDGHRTWSPDDKTLDAIGIAASWPLPNVWLGVTVENQTAANERIPLLLQTPAALRWLSCEPLLERVDVLRYLWGRRCPDPNCEDSTHGHNCQLGEQLLHWVVCGGESGSGAREMRPEWSDSLQEQCKRAGVPFFFKQHSAFRSGTVYPEKLPPGGLVRQFPEGHNAEVRRG